MRGKRVDNEDDCAVGDEEENIGDKEEVLSRG